MILTINGLFQNGHAHQLNLNSVLSPSEFLTSCDKIVYGGGKMRAFEGIGKTQNRNKSMFSTLANLLIFSWTEYIQLFRV